MSLKKTELKIQKGECVEKKELNKLWESKFKIDKRKTTQKTLIT